MKLPKTLISLVAVSVLAFGSFTVSYNYFKEEDEANSEVKTTKTEVKTTKTEVKDTLTLEESLDKASKKEESDDKDLVKSENAENDTLVEHELDSDSFKMNKNDNFIFIGDSRTVAMSKIVDITDYEFVTFISKSSKGYDWFSTEGLAKLEKRFATTDLNYNVVFNLGVNDLHNSSKYVELYNSLQSKYPQHNFFMASVNPADESKLKAHGYKYTDNARIEQFNAYMKENLSQNIRYIDSYNYLKENGFNTVDGLHYDNNSSIKILDYLSNTIKGL